MKENAKEYLVLLYYYYTPLANAAEFTDEHLDFCLDLGLLGRIIIADEGINGTVSGTREACTRYMNFLKNDPRFSGIDFKIEESDKHTFQKMHVRYKPEIVHMGLRNKNDVKPWERTGIHIDGETFLKMKEEPETVVLDVRSNYEHKLGRFKGAITLNIDNFREFPEHIDELETLKDKRVITYCTGGIKCEKASALMLEKGFKEVYQLHGGIIQYARETGGKDFDGECYVFDNRVSVPVNTVNPTIISTCHRCGTTTARMINCANPECNSHIPFCEKCGDEMQGACSDECLKHPRKRPYDGTGYYLKNTTYIPPRKHKKQKTEGCMP